MERKKLDRAEAPRLSEGTLFQLFDYQRFENDPQLQSLESDQNALTDTSVIDGVESAYGAELSDDELIQVSAAGELYRKKRTDGGGGGAT